MAAVTICSDFGAPQKIRSVTVSIVSPSICHEVTGLDAMILVFWMLSFKPAFSLSSFTFIKRLFSSSLSAIRVVSSAYLRLLISLPAILIPAFASSSLAFRMMYSAYKLNKQDDNILPWCTPFPTRNQSVFPCSVLTVASWPVYRFLKRQVRWSGNPHLLKNFSQFLMIYTVKSFTKYYFCSLNCFVILGKINWTFKFGSFPGFSILFHWLTVFLYFMLIQCWLEF